MKIRFSKRVDAAALTCVRADGSTTWTRLSGRGIPVGHDLLHYAVETTLGWRNAFFGLIAQGWDIARFAALRSPSKTLPREALHAEFIVGLLAAEVNDGPAAPEAFLATLARACGNGGLPQPVVTVEQVNAIRSSYRVLAQRWAKLPAGGTMELDFPEGIAAA